MASGLEAKTMAQSISLPMDSNSEQDPNMGELAEKGFHWPCHMCTIQAKWRIHQLNIRDKQEETLSRRNLELNGSKKGITIPNSSTNLLAIGEQKITLCPSKQRREIN
jgi:hypothetical protein